MEPRMRYYEIAPGALQAMRQLEKYVRESGPERSLLELVKIRVSQMNGCAFCIDMHAKDARARGESEQRIYLLNAWSESPLYTERERAALEWAEAVALITDGHVPDDVFEQARRQFSEQELIDLTMR